MHGSRGLGSQQGTAARLGALALAVVLCLFFAGNASAGRLVGKDGRVYACYATKGKDKGSVRLVAKKARCHKGEKKISWSVTGPSGAAGENGGGGENGQPGEGGPAGTAGLERQVSALTNKVTALEGVLKGITNTDLTGLLAKLQGISGAQLQQAVAAIADVNALCSQASVLTARANELTTALGGLSLNSILTGLGGLLQIPALPAMLPAFSCP